MDLQPTIPHPSTPLPLQHPSIDARLEQRAADLAAKYMRPRQREFALAVCSRHPRAVDYLEQAPILLVGLAERSRSVWQGATKEKKPGTPILFGPRHEQTLGEWRKVVELGWKLPKVMAHYHFAPQLRAILPGACSSSAGWPAVLMSRQMGGSALAQAIPPRVTAQRAWLKAQVFWYRRMLARGRRVEDRLPTGLDNPLAYTRWAAVAFGGRGACDLSTAAAQDIADFAIEMGERFNTRWTLTQAADECGLWHHRLELEGDARVFANDPPIDYAPFPDVFKASDGLEVVALRDLKSLTQEGAAMKHCVASYHPSVALGTSRIFSIRRTDGERLATFELSTRKVVETRPPGTDITHRHLEACDWHLSQTQGPRRHHNEPRPRLPGEAETALLEFIEAHVPTRRLAGGVNLRSEWGERAAEMERELRGDGL